MPSNLLISALNRGSLGIVVVVVYVVLNRGGQCTWIDLELVMTWFSSRVNGLPNISGPKLQSAVPAAFRAGHGSHVVHPTRVLMLVEMIEVLEVVEVIEVVEVVR